MTERDSDRYEQEGELDRELYRLILLRQEGLLCFRCLVAELASMREIDRGYCDECDV